MHGTIVNKHKKLGVRNRPPLKGSVMQNFLRFSLGYFVVAILIVTVFRDSGVSIIGHLASSSTVFFVILGQFTVGLVLLAGVATLIVGPKVMLSRLRAVAFATIACLFFQAAFTLIKTSLPFIVPFFADPYFAHIDQVLHFGNDPWTLTHAWAEGFAANQLVWVYVSVWGLPAMALPVIIAALDGNQDRVRRFLMLYVVGWVVLGNMIALAGMSAGPVYYDRLIGGDRFIDLAPALIESGVKATWIGNLQESLWNVYVDRGQAIGSGISAFPSVHVAMACVTALYLAERTRWLAPIGIAFVAIILFMSVYSGYHYAIDGYAAIIVVTVAYGLARRYIATRVASSATFQPITPAAPPI